jgi:DNA-binding transcriptional LysR family regulator
MCTIGPGALVELFRGYSTRYQGVEVRLSDAGAPALEAALAQGDLDVAIACNPESPDPALHRLPLYSERFLVGFAPGHPLARFNAVPMRALDGLAYLGRANCEYDGTIAAIQTGMGIAVRECYRSERDDWIQSMAAAGLGITLIPEFAVTLPVLSTRPLVEPEVVREVALVTVRGRPHSAAVGAFVHECRRYAWASRLAEGSRPGAATA